MKKSKLIVPAALAVMLMSTAASVTGTVAWFTANRAVTIEATQFEVTSTDGSLEVAISNGVNCAVDPSNAKKVVMTSGYKLTDASVDLTTSGATVYTDEARDDGVQPDTFNVVASPYNSGTTNVVLCVSWTLTFTYTFGGDTTPVNLFFDTNLSNVTQVDAGNLETGKGFRIGMKATSDVIVWADNQVLADCNYITNSGTVGMKDSTASHQTATYDSNTGKCTAGNAYTAYTLATTSSRSTDHINLVDSSVSLTRAADGSANQSQRGDYLGQITNSGGTGTLVVTCYAWYEGTDAYVVSKSVMNTMAASMTFYTRKNA